MTRDYAKLFDATRAAFAAIEARLGAPEAVLTEFDVVTREVDTLGEALKRQLLQSHATIRSGLEQRVEVTEASGIARTRARRGFRQVMTRFGLILRRCPSTSSQ